MAEIKTYEQLEQRIHDLEYQLKGSTAREYKSRLFSFLFGREENKIWTLSLYNAIHGTSHNDPSSITINTIEDVVYMGMKNDLSILVSETVTLYQSMELYEQQSSYNPNMPVREFMYAAKLYDKYIHSARLNQYGRSLMPLPLPKLVVFYNGAGECEDETVLSLSDAFKEEIRRNILQKYSQHNEKPCQEDIEAEVLQVFKNADPDIEAKVRMVNINHGHSKGLLSACKPLGEYAWFVAQARKNLAAGSSHAGKNALTASDAIDCAINEMPQHFEIKPFMIANRAEVKDMCLTEYNETETMELLRQEARQEGLRTGQQESRLLDLKNLMDSTGWTAEKAMDLLKIPQSQRDALYAGLVKLQ